MKATGKEWTSSGPILKPEAKASLGKKKKGNVVGMKTPSGGTIRHDSDGEEDDGGTAAIPADFFDGGAAGSSSEGEAPLPLQLPLPGLGAVHHSESLHLAAEAAATAADGEHSNALKKPRWLWSVELNNRFINALSHLVSVVSMSAERHLWGCGTWRPGQARPGGGRPRWPGCHGSVAPPCRAALVLYYCCRRA